MMMMMHACHLYIFLEGSVGITSNIDREFIITYIYIFFFLIIIESIIIVISHHPSIFFLLYNFCSYSSFFLCVPLSLSIYTYSILFHINRKKSPNEEEKWKKKTDQEKCATFFTYTRKISPVESTKKRYTLCYFFHFISPV